MKRFVVVPGNPSQGCLFFPIVSESLPLHQFLAVIDKPGAMTEELSPPPFDWSPRIAALKDGSELQFDLKLSVEGPGVLGRQEEDGVVEAHKFLLGMKK